MSLVAMIHFAVVHFSIFDFTQVNMKQFDAIQKVFCRYEFRDVNTLTLSLKKTYKQLTSNLWHITDAQLGVIHYKGCIV